MKKQIITKATLPATIDVELFGELFQQAVADADANAWQWATVAEHAPRLFGVDCFIPDTDDRSALRSVLYKAYGMPDVDSIPRKNSEEFKTASKAQQSKWAAMKDVAKGITATVGMGISRAGQKAANLGFVPELEKRTVTLEAWLKRVLSQCKGKKAIVTAPQSLVDAIESCMAQPAKAVKKTNVIKADFAPAKRRAVRQAVAA